MAEKESKEEILKQIEEKEKELENVQGTECEIWSRCVGYWRPVKNYNPGKQEEYKERKVYIVEPKRFDERKKT